MKVILYDFEVFKYDVLLGCRIIEPDGSFVTIQTWDKEEIRQFYYDNIDAIWVGQNIERYDNHILEAIVKNRNPKVVSDAIIHDNKMFWLRMPLNFFDIMAQTFVGLKVTEAYFGKNIHESGVSFDIDRPLTEEEKREVEHYNDAGDLDQTMDNFIDLFHTFELRLNMISTFGLPLSYMSLTGTQIAEKVLGAKKTAGIDTWVKRPTMYSTLQLKNEALIDYYMNEKFNEGEMLRIDICGVEHTIGSGGIHGAVKNWSGDTSNTEDGIGTIWYFDVSGYYNLIMLNYDLLPRSIPEEGRKLYEQMYYEQLTLKKSDPAKRGVYKTILLSVFGAMFNSKCAFYDPYHSKLVTLTGQLFMVDLLEKLEGKVELIQSNTDGIMAKSLVPNDEIEAIVNEWQERTGFVLKLEKIDRLFQRDVNNYMMKQGDSITTLGEAVKHYFKWQWPFWGNSFRATEAHIIPTAIVDYFMHDKMPEEVVAENMLDLRMFQQLAKKGSFTWLELQEDFPTGEQSITTVQNVNRVFASSDDVQRMIYKCKPSGKTKRSKVASLPGNIFMYNGDIRSDEVNAELVQHIDYEYYINRSYERIKEFMNFDYIKSFNDLIFEESEVIV